MARLTVMIGLDGSGRAERAQALGAPVVHSRREAEALLRDGSDVVWDAPNLRARERAAFAREARARGHRPEALLVAAPLRDCLDAQPGRAEEIRKQYLSFCPPQLWEGWARVDEVYPEALRRTPLDELFLGENGLMFLKQDNPFHAHTVGMHGALAARLCARERPDDPALWLAALLHDVGKATTKAWIDSHGRPSATAHFYGHECASAYEILFLRFPRAAPESERLRVSAVAAWHMTPHFFTNERTRARYERLWSAEFLRDLLLMDRVDREAQR